MGIVPAMSSTESERIDVLHKWAERLLSQTPPQTAVDRRKTKRLPTNTKITLTPVEPENLQPLLDAKVVGVTRDHSAGGFGLLTDGVLSGEVFFAEVEGDDQIFLLRRVRRRKVEDQVLEYGMQILDCYDSFDELAGT